MSVLGTVKVELSGIHCAKSTVAIEERADCSEFLSQLIAKAPDVKAATAAIRACVVFISSIPQDECTEELVPAAKAILILSNQPAARNGEIAGYVSQPCRR
jgi:hypothetical protein